jgi:phosphoenolpyruvate carboxykinase (GTP)
MCERIEGKVGARKTPIGLMPEEGDMDLAGLELSAENMKELMRVDLGAWSAEVPDIEKHFAKFGDRLPERLTVQLQELRDRLSK